jgi:hydroxymethylglutaryl-CoA lyase
MAPDFSIYEVGPRDGLQNLPHTISIDDRVKMVRLLAGAGLRDIEVGSFINPKRVPTMANTAQVFRQCADIDANLAALIPNARGMQDARDAGVQQFNIFFSADEDFNKRNLGCTRDDAVAAYADMLVGVPSSQVRVYVSLAFSSPLDDVADAIADADALGDTVVLCDTDGRASPDSIRQVTGLSRGKTALHLHYGALRERMSHNLTVAYEVGVREFDASIAGLGGCPFVKGSRGNLGTGELIAWGQQEGLDCGVTLNDIREAEELALRLSKTKVLV